MSACIHHVSQQPFLLILEDLKHQGNPYHKLRTMQNFASSQLIKVTNEIIHGSSNGRSAKHLMVKKNKDEIANVRRKSAVNAYKDVGKKIRRQSVGMIDSETAAAPENSHLEERLLRRVFIESPQHEEYGQLGWILSIECVSCMDCTQLFGISRWKHHCRCCGRVICDECSAHTAIVEEIYEEGLVRVCNSCSNNGEVSL